MLVLTLAIKILAGTGLFLFAMYLIEQSLKNISGRNFKIFLQRTTRNRFGAAAGGAIVTGILQSSSMVSLIVLAFVGAGVFTMQNALAIILGANIGTTISSWIVATLGFKMEIELIAYPVIFAGSILILLAGKRKKLKYVSYFLIGFGLLFMGLNLMKNAMAGEVQRFDLTALSDVRPVLFLVAGVVVTLVVQSSSVTAALTLSALHAGVIPFPAAALITLGSETGTTVKIMLGAIGGNATKKRIVLGNILFNVVLTIGAYVFLEQLLFLITDVFRINDHLIGLVAFSSLVNILSVITFLPFLGYFTRLLEWFFREDTDQVSAFIGNASVNASEAALDLFTQETKYFLYNCMHHNLRYFDIVPGVLVPEYERLNGKRKLHALSPEERYMFLKQQQGELQAFYLKLRATLEGDRVAKLNLLISSVRSSMYSIKCVKDIGNNISELRRSSKAIKYNYYTGHRNDIDSLYKKLKGLVFENVPPTYEGLLQMIQDIERRHLENLNGFYSEAQHTTLERLDISTVINFNREFFTSCKAMLMAVKDLVLDVKDAERFNETPVYRT